MYNLQSGYINIFHLLFDVSNHSKTSVSYGNRDNSIYLSIIHFLAITSSLVRSPFRGKMAVYWRGWHQMTQLYQSPIIGGCLRPHGQTQRGNMVYL